MNELSASRKKYYTLKKERDKLFHHIDSKNIYENTNPFENEYSVMSLMDNTFNRLIKRKEIVLLKKTQLINEVLNQKTPEEYLKNVKSSTKFANDEKYMIDLVNCTKKKLIKVKKFLYHIKLIII